MEYTDEQLRLVVLLWAAMAFAYLYIASRWAGWGFARWW